MVNEDDRHMALICLRTSNIEILMVHHKHNELPDFQQNSRKFLYEMQIRSINSANWNRALCITIKVILDMFPKFIILKEFIIVWNLVNDHSIYQLRENLNCNISTDELKTLDDDSLIDISYFILNLILHKPEIRWGFQTINKKSSKNLTTMAYNVIAKRTFISILETPSIEKDFDFKLRLKDYLEKSSIFTCTDFYDKLNFLSLIAELVSIMDHRDLSDLRDYYFSNIEQLCLPSIMKNELKLFFPDVSSMEKKIVNRWYD